MASTYASLLRVQGFWRTSRALGLAACTFALACGDSSGTTTAATTDATQGSTGATAGSTGPGTTGTTGEPVTTSGATMGGSTGPATTEATTGGGTTGADTTGGGTGTSDGSSGGTSAGTTGGMNDVPCVDDSDCSLMTNCCTCDVIAEGEVPAACPIMECLVDVCSTYDLQDSKPVCRFGRCTFSKISCNPAGVICKSLPPTCGPGTLPTLNANGDCWSGQCAPVEACDWAPDCANCVDKEDPLVCVFKAQKGAYHVCEPKPVDCGDVQDIDCGCGQQICDDSPPHTVCHDNKPGITCECPFC